MVEGGRISEKKKKEKRFFFCGVWDPYLLLAGGGRGGYVCEREGRRVGAGRRKKKGGEWPVGLGIIKPNLEIVRDGLPDGGVYICIMYVVMHAIYVTYSLLIIRTFFLPLYISTYILYTHRGTKRSFYVWDYVLYICDLSEIHRVESYFKRRVDINSKSERLIFCA